MGKFRFLLGLVIIWSSISNSANAAYFESASLGPAGVTYPGPVIFNNFFGSQFYGVRFEVAAPIQVTAVGAHIAGNPNAVSPLFAAIVGLSSATAMPAGSPLSPPLASATFYAPVGSTDLRIPLSVGLGAGYYGLIFGDGLFGSPTNGEATLINNGFASLSNLPDAYFAYSTLNFPGLPSGGVWQSMGSSNVRFVVEAAGVSSSSTGNGPVSGNPEPGSLVLLGSGLVALLVASRRK